jgi:uncharacterized phage-associated protein
MKAATRAHDASAFIVQWFAQDELSELVTNLKLQKLLYFSQSLFGALYERRLFAEPIEAWDMGPVVPNAYHEFKACGRHPIEKVEDARAIHDADARVALHLTCVKFGVYSANYLIKLTHQEPAWDKAYKLARNSEVEFEEMVQNFKDHWIDELELEDDYRKRRKTSSLSGGGYKARR